MKSSYFIDLPLKMEPIECSETSDISTQTPEKHPKENILHLTNGESLKSRNSPVFIVIYLNLTTINKTNKMHKS
jgi:hypothetical protein